ncbi:hypothetical protein F5Y16DRAFT_116316 [Xylariaceae sp. FL0255]|nr:hypothetical protein F5Y16DRAFT_116316 [Xylariaceae sp. FL0255]
MRPPQLISGSRALSFLGLFWFNGLGSLPLSDDLGHEKLSSDWPLHDDMVRFIRCQTKWTGAMILYIGAQAQKILADICSMSQKAFA